jgi:hypothetical protein
MDDLVYYREFYANLLTYNWRNLHPTLVGSGRSLVAPKW